MRLCVFLVLSAVSAVTAMPAQEIVPPPPAPAEAKPDLAPIMRSLERALLENGRVEWTQTMTTLDNKGRPSKITDPLVFKNSVELTKATVRDCKLQTFRAGSFLDSNLHPDYGGSDNIFLESVTKVEVETAQGNALDGFKATPAWRVAPFRFWFPTEQQANQAADALRAATKACGAFVLNPTAGSPNLEDTLTFIEGKRPPIQDDFPGRRSC